MSTKTRSRVKTPSPTRGTALRFTRPVYATIAVLAVLAGALTAANFAQAPRPNATSALAESSAPVQFEIYSLHRDDRLESDGTKKPDTIRGGNLTGGDSTVLVSARRIQEYVALPSALAVVTLNDDDTSSLEIVSLSGGRPVQVPLPESGRVENLHASGSKQLIGYSFTSETISDGYWKTLFVYDTTNSAVAPLGVQGIDGQPLSVWDWTFVPNTTSIVAQTDEKALYLIDVLGAGKPTPLGLHDEMRGFIPGTKELVVADRIVASTATATSTMSLTDGIVTPLDLPENARSATSVAGKTVLLDGNGRYAQIVSEYVAGKESAVVTVTDRAGSNVVYQPGPEWSRITDICVSPDGQFLAVQMTSPGGVSDNYPALVGLAPATTEIVDLNSGESVRSVAGFLPNWCR